MKVVVANTLDAAGGAARAAFRLHDALSRTGVDSEMLVARKTTDVPTVKGPDTHIDEAFSYLRPHFDALPRRFYDWPSRSQFSVGRIGASNLLSRLRNAEPDIVHLHWINGGFVGIHQLRHIKRPIVWSLHDMWPFTGGCHYARDGCRAFEDSCGRCPALRSNKARDLSRSIWARKHRIFDKIDDLTIIGLSKWITNEASQSSLFAGRRVVNLPNPIDSSVFRRIDRGVARELWKISPDARVVAFGAMNATSDRRKGYDLLVDALKQISVTGVELLVFGAPAPTGRIDEDVPFPVRYTGRLYDDVSLVTLYNAADVTIVPSRQENLSNTIMESLSCGTPVVGFDIGGNGDLIDHEINGYLAQAYEPEDLAMGIMWGLAGTGSLEPAMVAAREKVLNKFDYPVIARRYEALYRAILEGR